MERVNPIIPCRGAASALAVLPASLSALLGAGWFRSPPPFQRDAGTVIVFDRF